MAYADDPAPYFSNQDAAPPVTVDSLLLHYRKYGLDNAHTGYKGKPEKYTNYTNARADSLLHVARTFLTEAAYIQVLEGCGYHGWNKAASEDWRRQHGQA